jgi:transcriptional regulator with XRE-family HTH domain
MAKTIPNLLTAHEIQVLLGQRLKTLRLQASYRRQTLANRSGVSVGSLKRFETTGEVSLKNLLRLAQALDRLSEFSGLLSLPDATSLSDLEARVERPLPKRGKI